MDDLKTIKKYYGEKMMHLCRELFPTLLETPGLLSKTLLSRFNPSRHLYYDIVDNDLYDSFKSIILHALTPKEEKKFETSKTPQELLDEAGYTLYECHTEEDIQSFKKYYAKNEELCTFGGGRLGKCYVFFAVKKNVDEIKRENFPNPERQDEYGTSVISIQFRRGLINTLSIKNRYNHTVRNPDATFSNNLENIIPGLTEAFEETYSLSINENDAVEDMPGYVLAEDGKYYKYYYEENNIYYCPDNIIIDNSRVIKFDKSRYLVIENYILDMQDKIIEPYDRNIFESFTRTIPYIEKIVVENIPNSEDKKIIINDDIEIVIDNTNQMKGYKNPNITEIANYFLNQCKNIEWIDLPNVEIVKNYFASGAIKLKSVNLPKCEVIGSHFLYRNSDLETLELPNVETVYNDFLASNRALKSVNLPQCKMIGPEFISKNNELESIDLPNVEKIKTGFLRYNKKLKEINLPMCTTIDSDFLECNQELESIDLPNVKYIGQCFLKENMILEKINIPKCVEIGYGFLKNNTTLRTLELSSDVSINYGDLFENNPSIEIISGPRK